MRSVFDDPLFLLLLLVTVALTLGSAGLLVSKLLRSHQPKSATFKQASNQRQTMSTSDAAAASGTVNIPPHTETPPSTTALAGPAAGAPSIPTQNQKPEQGAWVVAGASVIGASHVQDGKPCQDAHQHRALQHGWGVIAVCDGAGSRAQSHVGAQFVAERAVERFADLVEKRGWRCARQLPTEGEWTDIGQRTLWDLHQDLEARARQLGADIESLACTVIVVVYSPIGLLLTHIGDGRAGYRVGADTWHPLMTPFEGEEANQTWFITTAEVWQNFNQLIECRVLAEPVTAFVAMSDGCQSHAFECGFFDEEHQRFIKKNQPYPGFFAPITRALEQMHLKEMPAEQISDRWQKFLAHGTEGLRTQSDDKTMVLGIYVESDNADRRQS